MDKNAKRLQSAMPKAAMSGNKPFNKSSTSLTSSGAKGSQATGGVGTLLKSTPGFKPRQQPLPVSQQQQQQQQEQSRTGGESTNAQPPADSAEQAPAKVKKPKPPKPQLDPNEQIVQRAYVGGLAQDVTSSDLEGRFKSFGQLKDAYVAKDVEGLCRGFGYITLDTTRREWQKCVALFNGAKWKGHVMKIEEANKDWTVRRQEDLEKHALQETKKAETLLKKKSREPVKHAPDMTLVNYKTMEGRRGWKRGRYGQPVLTMRLDKLTYDPSHYKNNLERLHNSLPNHPQLPIHKLLYQIDESEPIPKAKHLPSEVVLAPFLAKIQRKATAPAPSSEPMDLDVVAADPSAMVSPKARRHGQESKGDEEEDDDMVGLGRADVNINTSADRGVMASILAGMDFSPKAALKDDSDLDDSDLEGVYSEDVGIKSGGGALFETTADDMFGDLPMLPDAEADDDEEEPKQQKKIDRESRPEDLFGADEEDEEDADQPSLDFLDEEEEDEEEEEEEEEDDDYDEEEDEDDGDGDEEGISDDVAREIAKLQSSTSTSSGGLFDSDDEEGVPAEKSAAEAKAEESEQVRVKAIESRQIALETAREKQRQMIAGSLAQMDSHDKKEGHVVFAESDDEDSDSYEKTGHDRAAKMASGGAKSIFDSDSEEEPAPKPLKIGKSRLDIFGSDEEDEGSNDTLGGEDAFGIKEQFEGPGGRALFKMQTRIGTSDSRFQLTKDFLDDTTQAEDEDYEAHQDMLRMKQGGDPTSFSQSDIIMDEDQQAQSNVEAEKNQALSVLRAMFGDEIVHNKKKEEDSARKRMGGTGAIHGLITRFDPTATPAPAPAPVPASESEDDEEKVQEARHARYESEDEEEEEEDQDEDAEDLADEVGADDDEPLPGKKSAGFSFGFNFGGSDNGDGDDTTTKAASASSANDDNTPHFQVASDLKSLFAPATGSFKLFGGDDEEEDEGGDSEKENFEVLSGVGHEELKSVTVGSKTTFTDEREAQALQQQMSHSGSLFFFHFNHPYLQKRSPFRPQQAKVFMRTGTLEEVTAQWEKTRQGLTQEYKRKHRSAARNRERAAKRVKTKE
ncbi:hypothetical protein DFQ26_003293 [Actinomortierella ambigua]|nr:hypothetical protein DFQ26_003293 [Actinomortierella ambigua]